MYKKLRFLLFDDEREKVGSEYWYPLRVSSDTEGWALGARNGVAFLIPLPESSGLGWWRLAQNQPDAGTWVREASTRRMTMIGMRR